MTSTTGEDITPTSYDPAYGGIPTLPAYATDTTTGKTTSTTGGKSTSTVLGTDIYGQLVKNLPNYQSMVAESSGNIGAWLRGQIPSDVIQQLAQRSAEWGVAGGFPGGANVNAQLMKALGLTSLQLQQMGEGALTGAIQRTPIQQSQTTTQDTTQTVEQAVDQVQKTDLSPQQAVYNAYPSPAAAAKAELSAARAGQASAAKSVARPGGISMPSGGGGGSMAPATASMDARTLYATNPQEPYVSKFPMKGNYYDLPGMTGWSGGMSAMDKSINDWASSLDWGQGYMPTSKGSMYMGEAGGYTGAGGALGIDYMSNMGLWPYAEGGETPPDTYYNALTDQSVYAPSLASSYYNTGEASAGAGVPV